jgi:putative membrane protein
MQHRVREHVPATTGLLTAVSLVLVFGAALGAIPGGALPHAPAWVVDAIPHANAVVSALAIGTIVGGVRAIRRGRVERHRRLMLTTFALFAVFLLLYLYRIVLEGPATFPGPEAVYGYVYLPVLAIHILLAVLTIPLVYYALLLAWTRSVSELASTRHATVGRAAAALWLISFTLGEVVYAMLYLVY